MDQQFSVERMPYAAALVAVTIIFAAMLIAVLIWTGGVFVYSLDDPYIHLAMADQIRHGRYGVNPGEPASASSSIAYPYLVALGLLTGTGALTPLILNYLAAVAAIVLVLAIVRDTGLLVARPAWWLIAAIAIAWAMVTNMLGIAFMGMEHSLQAALALLAFLGLARFLRSDHLPPWLPVVLGLQVAIRFEGAAVVAASMLVLVLRGRWRIAMLVGGIAATVLGLFTLHLRSLGLPPLPSSVLVKARTYWTEGAVAAQGSDGSMRRLFENVTEPSGVLLLVLAMLLLWLGFHRHGEKLWPPWIWSAERLIALFVTLCICAHLVVGAVDWPHRYENYLVVLGMAAMIMLAAPILATAATRRRVGIVMLMPGLLLLAAAFNTSIVPSLFTPLTAREMHLQQNQMRRFAHDFVRGPVAVNDLGLAVWRNPHYVLDLWGLASDEARIARLAGGESEWMARLARRRDVSLAMIYDRWFGRVPASWHRIGYLAACAPTINAGGNRVAFYATDARHLPQLSDLVKQWRRDLPTLAYFVFEGEAPPPCTRR